MNLKQFRKRLASFGEVGTVYKETIVHKPFKGKKDTDVQLVGFLTVSQMQAQELAASEFLGYISVGDCQMAFLDFIQGTMLVTIKYPIK